MGDYMSSVNEKVKDLETIWPVKEIKEEGCYFYNLPIEKHISTTEVEVRGKGKMIMFGGYSYLSLHNHPKINAAVKNAIDKHGSGVHGVRLLAGTTDIHKKLEGKISALKRTEDAITYSSGYMANFSTIAALMTRHDTIFSDKLNHASIVDGCMLSNATQRRFRHNDMSHLEELLKQDNKGRLLVIADAVFSMDGDIIDLPQLSWLCKKHGALLMIDECHSLGVIGKTGKGIEEHFNLPAESIDIKMGTLGKSIPSQGGYIASSDKICHFLRHQSRGFIYSGANTPGNDAASIAAIDIIESEPERVKKLHDNVSYAKASFLQAGIPVMDSETAIMPILCGEDWSALKAARHCHSKGIYVQAIPYPVVPKGKARLRLSINTDHSREQIDYLLKVLLETKDRIS